MSSKTSRRKKAERAKPKVVVSSIPPPVAPQKEIIFGGDARIPVSAEKGDNNLLDWDMEKTLYHKCRAYFDSKDYKQALHCYNQALLFNPSDMTVRKERDMCKMILGHLTFPDLVEEPLERVCMSFTQRRAYDRAHPGKQVISEVGATIKPTAEQEMLINGYQSLYGWGTLKNPELAVEFFKTAAGCSDNGNNNFTLTLAEAKYILGLMLLHGEGLPADEKAGLKVLEEVALMDPRNDMDKGNAGQRFGVAEAQCALGIHNFEGAAHDKPGCSFQMAAFWFHKARANKSSQATTWLAYMYFSGRGVPKDEKVAESMWKSVLMFTSCRSAYSYLVNMYIEQFETTKMRNIMRRALERNDPQLTEVIQRVTEVGICREEERRLAEKTVEVFEKEEGMTAIGGVCFRDRLRRAKEAHHVLMKGSQLAYNCNGKFAIQVSTFNEDVKNRRIFADGIDVISNHVIDNMIWKASIKQPIASSILDMLVRYSNLLILLCQHKDDLSVFAEDHETAYTLLTTLSTIMEHDPFYLKWEPGHAQLLFRALKVIASANYEKDQYFIQYLETGLAIIGAIVDPNGEGLDHLIHAWTFHPTNVTVTRNFADHYYRRGDFNRAYVILKEGLERDPRHVNLLYWMGMVCLRNESRLLMDTVGWRTSGICYLEKFLNMCSRDHPKVPEAYFLLARTYYELNIFNNKPRVLCYEILKFFVQSGKDAEQAQLMCFTPYESANRDQLERILEAESQIRGDYSRPLFPHIAVRENTDSEYLQLFKDLLREHLKSLERSLKAEEKDRNGNFKVSRIHNFMIHNIHEDENRRDLILKIRNEFREALEKNIEKRSIFVDYFFTPSNFVVLNSFKSMNQLKPICAHEIQKDVELTYENRALCLTVIDEPFSGLGSGCIRFIAEDTTRFVFLVKLFRISQDETVPETFGFGSKLFVLHPKIKEGGRVVEVLDPNSILFDCKPNDLCRYCLAPDATKSCSRCKWAKYCNRECQTNDWKILKHKFICQALPFWNMTLRERITDTT